MANANAAAVLAKLSTRPYFAQFKQLYGAAAASDPATALARMGAALAKFETESIDFRPFSSKFDFWRKGQAKLTAQERTGFALFSSGSKGNCAACHSNVSADGKTPALFTDFSYDNLGVPRNHNIAANDNATTLDYVPVNSQDGVHSFYDTGLCGPFRTDLRGNTDALCGAFKVPSLRDVALTAPYFHNGEFASLQDAIGFYVRRDTNPEQWFTAADAPDTFDKFDDLPALFGGQFKVDIVKIGSDAGYRGNVNTVEVPYNRHIGMAPALTPADIQNVVAFLCILTDGYDPSKPAAYNAALPKQCPQSSAPQ
jgi:cytochrome c peroxidase